MRPIVDAAPMIETTKIVGPMIPVLFLGNHFYLETLLLPTSHVGLELIGYIARVKLLNCN